MSGVTSSDDSIVDINELLNEFYDQPIGHSQLGEFESITSVPPPYDRLLDHHAHMTVTVESHYGQGVDVHVHRHRNNGDWYARDHPGDRKVAPDCSVRHCPTENLGALSRGFGSRSRTRRRRWVES